MFHAADHESVLALRMPHGLERRQPATGEIVVFDFSVT